MYRAEARQWSPLALAFLSLVMVSARVVAADTPEDWLERMARAGQSLNYSGTFVYRRDDQLVAVNILHIADERGGRERLVALNGSASEVVRSCDGAVCFLPRRKSIVVNKLRGKHAPDGDISQRVAELRNHYRFTAAGDDRVAGRTARAFVIEPADQYRYGYRIWVDEETGLLLKSDMVDNGGATVEQIMFTALEVIASPTEDMLAAVDQKQFSDKRKLSGEDVVYSDENGADASESWRVENIPDGFRPVQHFRHRRSAQAVPTEHMIFTDGLASVSVFIDKPDNGHAPVSGISAMGAVNVYGTVIGGHHVTVVGEVPSLTVRLIGESVRHAAGE